MSGGQYELHEIVSALYRHWHLMDEVVLDYSRIYMFGSALTSNRPGDVDLLFVYDCGKLPIVLPSYKRFSDHLSSIFPDLSLDITILSEAECAELRFLEQVCYLPVSARLDTESACIRAVAQLVPAGPEY